MIEPRAVEGWNVAELAGGLLLSCEGFILQLSTEQVDKFLEIMNTGRSGTVRDSNGDQVQVSVPNRDHVILTRVGDETYPGGIILPVTAFSEIEGDEPVIEEKLPAFQRNGAKIKRVFTNTLNKDNAPFMVMKAKFIRALRTELPKTVTSGLIIRRLKLHGSK